MGRLVTDLLRAEPLLLPVLEAEDGSSWAGQPEASVFEDGGQIGPCRCSLSHETKSQLCPHWERYDTWIER